MHWSGFMPTFAGCMKYLMWLLLHLEIYCFMLLLNFTTFRYSYIVPSNKFSLVWNLQFPCIYFQIHTCCNGQFPGFGECVIPQLQTCTALVLSAADCTESSCSSKIGCNFDKFLVFKFPFFNFKQQFPLP